MSNVRFPPIAVVAEALQPSKYEAVRQLLPTVQRDADARVSSNFVHFASRLLGKLGFGNPNRPIKTTAGKLTQAQVDAIVEKCGGPSGMAKINSDELVINPAKNPSITMCVLDALQATGETALRLPSVGNQRYHVGPTREGN